MRSATWVFSHCVIDCVSLLLILLFMQVQYFSTTAADASPLLSATHWLIHLTSSVVTAFAVVVVIDSAASSTSIVVFMKRP